MTRLESEITCLIHEVMEKEKKDFPQIFQKSLKEIISNLDFEENLNFPNEEE